MQYNVSSYRDEAHGLVAVEYDLEALSERNTLRPLAALHAWWAGEHAASGGIPRTIPSQPIRAAGMARNVHIYDVTEPEPLDYRILYWGRNAALDGYRLGTAKTFGEFEPRRYAIWAASSVHQVKSCRLPALHYVMSNSVTGTAKRHRLMLPLARDGVAVDRIMSAWIYDALSVVG